MHVTGRGFVSTWVIAGLPLLLVSGCTPGGDDDDDNDSGKAAVAPAPVGTTQYSGGLTVVESGRFLKGGAKTGHLQGRVLHAYRVASYGGTRIQVSLSATGGDLDPVLVVDGSLPGASVSVVATNDDKQAGSKDAQLEVTLPQNGVYRLLVTSYKALSGSESETGDYRLSFQCLEKCTLPQLSLAEFLAQLKADHGQQAVDLLFKQVIPSWFQDSTLTADLQAQADALVANTSTNVDAFPVVPVVALRNGQGFLEESGEGSDVPPPGPVTFDLAQILSTHCQPTRGSLTPAHAQIPELMRGEITDHRFDDCALMRAQQLAEVLNNLALENGSAVIDQANRYETVEAAIRGLISAGHRIQILNNRYYADFMGLYYKNQTVALPAWIKTDIALGNNSLTVPAPHSHYHVIIEGPLLNAELKFFMGIPGGTAFRAHAFHARPWSGEQTSVTLDSTDHLDQVVRMFVLAGKLRKKWLEAGANLPAQGYGKLGVCMDSTAILEYGLHETTSLYPLAHPVFQGTPADEIDQILAALPSDMEGNTGAATALDRLLKSQPFDPTQPVNLQELPFPSLKAQMDALP